MLLIFPVDILNKTIIAKLLIIFLSSKTISVLYCYVIGTSIFLLLPDAVLVLGSELEHAEELPGPPRKGE